MCKLLHYYAVNYENATSSQRTNRKTVPTLPVLFFANKEIFKKRAIAERLESYYLVLSILFGGGRQGPGLEYTLKRSFSLS